MSHTHYWSHGGVVRGLDTRAEACPSSENGKRSARDVLHAKTDPAVARARARRSPQTCRTRAGDEHSLNGPQKCAALHAATAPRCLKVKTRPRSGRGCSSLSAPPASGASKGESENFRKSHRGPGGMEGEPRSRASGRLARGRWRGRRRTEQNPRAFCRLSIASPCASRGVTVFSLKPACRRVSLEARESRKQSR